MTVLQLNRDFSEAEYTRKLQRPFVPIWMQRHYKPDGWLGFILGDKFYVDFAKFDFNKAYAMLKQQIEGLDTASDGLSSLFAYEEVHVHNFFRTADVDGPVKAASAASVGANPNSPHPPLMTRRTTVMLSEIAEWSTADIKKWVKESGLEK